MTNVSGAHTPAAQDRVTVEQTLAIVFQFDMYCADRACADLIRISAVEFLDDGSGCALSRLGFVERGYSKLFALFEDLRGRMRSRDPDPVSAIFQRYADRIIVLEPGAGRWCRDRPAVGK